ncbi:MAG: ABC transporter substrate-binding protein [Chelatococcus sp.]|jgi:branched-chain amino acid transport system substrate-binding protein|uniref:ABC transporter substrate-binding protein n=1 Tax=Chelatococcus sp. TaxID=1953771 RepID=UPI0025B95713|nr:ABC transporter substrate-binding protein [Chelatococcus sp.]MBX3536794.1 ABC transporter substrate-binding protein [Chelatococcus sp.]
MLRRQFLAASAIVLASTTFAPLAHAQGEPVKIGMLAPVRTVLGNQAVEAAKIAIDMANAKGGLNGRPFQLVVYDDGNSPVEGVSGMQRLVDQDNVKIVIGPYGSTVALAGLPIATAEELLYLPVAAKHPDVTTSGYDKVFRFNSTVKMDGDVLVEYMQKANPKGIAYIGENNDTGRAYLAGLRAMFPKDPDNRVVFNQLYDTSSSDYSGLVTAAKASGAEMLYLAGNNVEQYGNIMRVAKELGYKPKYLVLAPGILNARAVELANGGAEGAICTDIYVPSMPGAENAAFVEAYKKKVGIAPEKLELLWFEGASVVTQAIQKAGTTDIAKLAALIHQDTWTTPRGELKFDKTGQALSTPFIVEVKDGRIQRQ